MSLVPFQGYLYSLTGVKQDNPILESGARPFIDDIASESPMGNNEEEEGAIVVDDFDGLFYHH